MHNEVAISEDQDIPILFRCFRTHTGAVPAPASVGDPFQTFLPRHMETAAMEERNHSLNVRTQIIGLRKNILSV